MKELDDAERKFLDFTSDQEDEEVVKEIVEILCKRKLTMDRASRILADAQKILPFLTKMVNFKEIGR